MEGNKWSRNYKVVILGYGSRTEGLHTRLEAEKGRRHMGLCHKSVLFVFLLYFAM
jgi:hypothetical protein